MVDNLCVVAFSDGLLHAGGRKGESLQVDLRLAKLLSELKTSQEIADDFLNKALQLDEGRQGDDTSVTVLQILTNQVHELRRSMVRLPVS